jgi:cysteine desulfurase/selenocysteine lyase
MIEVNEIRNNFPILGKTVNGKTLVYFDNAATSQKPDFVIEAIAKYYRDSNANVHRGVHALAEESTGLYDLARAAVSDFIGAEDPSEIIFTKNSTESLNLIARSFGDSFLKKDDEIVLSEMEHHSNIVPWQEVAKRTGAIIRYLSFDENGELSIAEAEKIISNKTKIVSLVHISNFLGTVNPIEKLSKVAHSVGAVLIVDAAQSVPHKKVSVKKLDCDFMVFSGHKMLGPMGVGVLYGRKELLQKMPPFLTGGDMIRSVTLEKSTWNDLPYKFEAGTPNVSGAFGLSKAIEYLNIIGMDEIAEYESRLTAYAYKRLITIKGIKIYGPKEGVDRGGLLSFNIDGIHAHDLATLLDREGIAIRSGHHCAMPAHQKIGIPASARASFYFYNTEAEVDKLIEGIEIAKRTLRI